MLKDAQEILKHYYGHEAFRDGQETIMQHLFSGASAIGIMPTGGGKSICYQIPSQLLNGVTLVISPLISLMKDQVDELKEAGIPATFLNSSLSQEEGAERFRAVRRGEYSLVYIAPERLESPSFMNMLRNLHVSLVAVDEAHCLSQWGHDFRPSYMRIPEFLAQIHPAPPVLALTATATPEVAADIRRLLDIPKERTVLTGFTRENLSFHVHKGIDRDKFIRDYVKENAKQSGIIYAATRKEVERLGTKLKKAGIAAGTYHGGMSSDERKEMQDAFVYDELTVMVATNAFGMGINKSNVRFVIHAQMPRNIESYYQEAGRAGRDGSPSECILLFHPQDTRIQQFLIDQSDLAEDRKKNEYDKLQDIVNFCHTEGCLERYILDYFGDPGSDTCGKCSSCIDERSVVDITKEAQMVLSCIKRMDERFGKTIVAQVLVGSSNQKMKDFSFQRLSTYGLMKGAGQKEVMQLIDYLVASRYIALSGGQYPVLKLTEHALPVLKNEEKVMRKQTVQPKKITEDDPLFDMLRELRSQLADQNDVAPYMVFSDQTLREFCRFRPKTHTEFLKIKGVGETKLAAYGDSFISAIRTFSEQEKSSVQS
ncbi:DNA helicase RecQ [Salisediminibacterium halotolerans]|uniref:DNA helicase RecQ n=1 Tax=Salisediminibacterium halotolerans TaxID=517425 RepID=UPI000EABC7EC|nr:DNA helicase RecQ [Salisediminibacterium halotolerans]RLJ79326.1 RecQ-like ATP-dependent DNA helicase [Actinophytocola xinjiangensis]RPE86961.1 RecQ-like ATP-dependent DNA helicase [Salisediminibacterium halotolerans]TWG37770.1 RecQ-like ATP-dependent DNA helicase [Salisediminibacterium halotolerans]GEL09197.1 ATP-dependent DNA helicase RecQ [Salisediminibacterium halotolerans]